MKVISVKASTIAVVFAISALVSGCNTTDQQNAVIGGATGAVIGGVATGTLKGAAVGTAVGVGAGVLIGRIADGSLFCRYQRSNGTTYVRLCP